MTAMMTRETHLLPPDPSQAGPHILGQDSWYKGSRLVDATWDPVRGTWHMLGFRYGAAVALESQWVYVAPGTLAESGISEQSETTVRIPDHELHPYRS